MYGQPIQSMQAMYGQAMQQAQQGPTIIQIDGVHGGDGSPCQFCRTNTGQIVRKKIGCVAIAWGLCLIWFPGVFYCISCCMNGFNDSELVCIMCRHIKNTVPANLC